MVFKEALLLFLVWQLADLHFVKAVPPCYFKSGNAPSQNQPKLYKDEVKRHNSYLSKGYWFRNSKNSTLSCGFDDETAAKEDQSNNRIRRNLHLGKKDFLFNKNFFIRTLIYVDPEVTKLLHGGNFNKTEKWLQQIMTDVNSLYEMYRVHFQIKAAKPYPHQNLVNIKIPVSQHKILSGLANKDEINYLVKNGSFDMMLLFLGQRPNRDGLLGLAFHNSLCSQRSVAIIAITKLMEIRNYHSIVETTAHEIGHILGARHDWFMDNWSCDCETQSMVKAKRSEFRKVCLMYPGEALDGDRHRLVWSDCSTKEFSKHLYGQKRMCMWKPKVDIFDAQLSICGNGVIEEGEECDCRHYQVDCRKLCNIVPYDNYQDPLISTGWIIILSVFGILLSVAAIVGAVVLFGYVKTMAKKKRDRVNEMFEMGEWQRGQPIPNMREPPPQVNQPPEEIAE